MSLTEGSTDRKPARPRKGKREQSYEAVRKRVSSLKPSPENLQLYRAIDPDDPDNIRLDKSIKSRGLFEPLIITLDNYVVAGHRRLTSLLRIGQRIAPCRRLNVRRDSISADEYIALLREHNVQRSKSVAEQIREELVDVDPDDAHADLLHQD
jgi:ParB-like chromosome segregation protein Spo0J